MSIKKILSFVLCLALCLCVFTGCGSKEKSDEPKPAVNPARSNALMIINGKEISFQDFKYFLNYYKSTLESYTGDITDWSTELFEGYTYNDYVLESARDWYTYAAAIRMQAERIGAEITDEDKEYLEQQWKNTCDQYGGEAGLLSQLSATGCTKELYMYILETSYLSDKCYKTMFGERAEAVTDEQCAERAEEQGYIMAKHILILTDGTAPDGTEVHLNDEEKAEAKQKAQSIVQVLNNVFPEELEAQFDELMKANSEDPGSYNYPNGYLFKEGDMVPEFYEATKALEIGQYSDVVESSYGYHVIFRVPIDYDTPPIASNDYGFTFRYMVGDEILSAEIDDCKDRLEITKDIDISSIDLTTIFAYG